MWALITNAQAEALRSGFEINVLRLFLASTGQGLFCVCTVKYS